MEDRSRWPTALGLALPLLAGCAITIGGADPDVRIIDGKPRPLRQKGTANLVESETGVTKVYYPVPYASPPNLTLDTFHATGVELVDQSPDHFTIRAKSGRNPAPFGIEWTAVGMPATSVPPPLTELPLTGPEMPLPPPEPLPQPQPLPGADGP